MYLVPGSLNVLQQWMAYVSSCMELPMQAPACQPFWTWVMGGSFAFGGVIGLFILWKILSHRMMLAAALKAEKQRALVDHDAIAARRWDGDKAYSAELGGDEIARRIREAVEQRRAASPAFPDLVTQERRGE